MRKIGKWVVPLALVVTFLALPVFVSAAPSYQLTLTPQPADDTSTIPAGARDLTGAYYGWDATNQYFKVGLRKTPKDSSPVPSVTDSWNIYIDSKTGGGQPTSNSSLIGIDYIINNTYVVGSGSNKNHFDNLKLWTWNGSVWTSSTPTGLVLTNGTANNTASNFPLEWTFTRNGTNGADALLGINYDFWFGTANGFTPGTAVNLYDLSPKYHTPIPSAAWLLGSGIIGLIGLQRRRARKA